MTAKGLLRRLKAMGRAALNRPGTGPVVPPLFTPVYAPEEQELIDEARPYTMTGVPRMVALMDAVAYVARGKVPGALLECGVWRGGSILLMIRVLQRFGDTDRQIYLYDTFEGMTRPTEADTSEFDPPALSTWESSTEAGKNPWSWAFAPEIFSVDQVKEVLYATGYPRENIHFVVGTVEETIPKIAPEEIALIRLDTDWYESTKHELDHLYPRLSPGGVLLIDDYGHWDGARRAVDEYFETQADPLLLARVDYTGRMGVKS
jgi:O-methyltransferase